MEMLQTKWQHEQGREMRNMVIVSGNQKQFAGSDLHRSWQEVAGYKPGEGRQGQDGKEL